MRTEYLLEVKGISKSEEENTQLSNVSFSVQAGQRLAIAGATGSGKTTLLKTIGGLLQPDTGVTLYKGKKVEGPEEKLMPGHPEIAYLSQHFELRNHYHVNELLEMVNKLDEQQEYEICRLCRVDHLLQRWSHQLSGGERQRIALAAMLIRKPQLLLLDEPFSNLDAINKNILKQVINEISEEFNITTILVSHDPIDILSWAEDIIVMNEGKIVQQGNIIEVYLKPVNEYVAGLFGKYNIVDRTLQQLLDIENAQSDFSILRPGEIQIERDDLGKAIITSIIFMGSYYEVSLLIDNRIIIIHTTDLYEIGDHFVLRRKRNR
jgi:iron(III) transport system ATP-binding protein